MAFHICYPTEKIYVSSKLALFNSLNICWLGSSSLLIDGQMASTFYLFLTRANQVSNLLSISYPQIPKSKTILTFFIWNPAYAHPKYLFYGQIPY